MITLKFTLPTLDLSREKITVALCNKLSKQVSLLGQMEWSFSIQLRVSGLLNLVRVIQISYKCFPHLQISHCSGSSSTQSHGEAEGEARPSAPTPGRSSGLSPITVMGPRQSSLPLPLWSNPALSAHYCHHLHRPVHYHRCVAPVQHYRYPKSSGVLKSRLATVLRRWIVHTHHALSLVITDMLRVHHEGFIWMVSRFLMILQCTVPQIH